MNIDYSVVIPVYCNEGCLTPLMESLKREVIDGNPTHRGEIVFVDDGSSDGSFEELQRIQKSFLEPIRVVRLTRNFGQANALFAGYSYARGKCVITMSADGQDPPDLINEMLKAFYDETFEVVICGRSNRDESLYRIVTSRLFYYLIRKMTFPDMPSGGFDFWLMSRRALEAFIRNSDAYPFFQGQLMWLGFKTKFLYYDRKERLAGFSKWTFAKKVTYLLDGMLAYSFAPIRIMSLAGCGFSLLGFGYAGVILLNRSFFGNAVKGWAPLMIVLLVIGGFQMIMLGVIGEYLWRTLAQVRRRDRYLIDAVYDSRTVD